MARLLGRPPFGRRLGPRLVVLAAALLLAQFTALTGAAPAQAATCTSRVHEGSVMDQQVTATVRAGYDFAPACSDGTARVWGYVTDPLCDGRAAQLRWWIYDKLSNGTYSLRDSRLVVADNGCGSTSTFNLGQHSPGATGWRFRAEIRACSNYNLNCSTPGTLWYYG